MMLEATCKIPFAEVYEKLQMLIDQGQFELLSDDLEDSGKKPEGRCGDDYMNCRHLVIFRQMRRIHAA